jgi:hypothetical protein
LCEPGSAGAGRFLARERANEDGRATTRPHRYDGIFLGGSLMPRLIRQHRGRFPPYFIYRTVQRRERPLEGPEPREGLKVRIRLPPAKRVCEPTVPKPVMPSIW